MTSGRVPTDAEQHPVAIVLLLDDEPKEARRLLEQRFGAGRDTLAGVLLALARDQAGDAKARDATLKLIATHREPTSPVTARAMGALGDLLAKGDEAVGDLGRLAAIVGEIDPARRPNTGAIVGVFLQRNGRADAALDYLRQADVPECFPWFRYLVRDALRVRGVDPSPFPWTAPPKS